jgi:hypothetical protein
MTIRGNATGKSERLTVLNSAWQEARYGLPAYYIAFFRLLTLNPDTGFAAF